MPASACMAADTLPIYEIEPGLLDAWRAREECRRFVIEAPTGSGKSTQLPQMLWNNDLLGGGEVIILQPRRIAARMLARRVAEEMRVRLGDEVGYQVRFEGAVSGKTRIRFVTEGILLRRMVDDPQLRGVSAIIFDEFHERHLYGDISLARAMELQESVRPDLSLLVMSATLQIDALKRYLGETCTHLVSEGRTYPVSIRYAPQRGVVRGEIWDHAARVCGDAMAAAGEGHALIFMPGSFEIRKTIEALSREKWAKGFDILPLHGELTPQQQDAAVSDSGRRRIVVATNVAETSLTIDGVRAVIDAGLARIASWDAQRGINTLTVQSISRASADQRAGRAGRTGPGVAMRLWSEQDHGRRAAAEVPEILRLDLAEVVLTLKAAGIPDLEKFRWFEAPEPRAMERALTLLHDIGAIDAQGAITREGRDLTRFPLHPRHARVLTAAAEAGLAAPAALCVALLQGRPLFVRGGGDAWKKFQHPDDWSDFLPLIRGWQAASDRRFSPDACGAVGVNGRAASEASRLAERLANMAAEDPGEIPADPQTLHHADFACAWLAGFSDQVAKRTTTGGSACVMVGGRRGSVAKESVVRGEELLVAAEIQEVQGRDVSVSISMVTEIRPEWLQAMFPGDFSSETGAAFDAQQRRAVRRELVRFRDLILRDRQAGEADEASAAAILADEVMRGNLVLTDWNDQITPWLARLDFLRTAMPELEFPEFTEDDRRLVLEELFHGRRTFREIKDLNPISAFQSWLGWEKSQALDRHAPERVEIDTGKKVRVDYTRPQEPTLSVFIQQLFSQKDTPKVAGGRVPLVLTILAPNHRPIQVTRDLAGFWKNHYPKLKAELSRRYPRHEWREM